MSEILNWYTLNESISLCRQGKMWKDSMIDAVSWSDFYICELLEQLSSGMIIISDFWHSIIYERGKERLLCSLKVMDRVEQKAINRNFLLPAFVPSLMRDNVASLEGRGMDDAIQRLTNHLRHAYNKHGLNFFIAKLDIKSYFDNIPHEPLYNMICTRTSDQMLLKYFETLFKKYKYDPFIHAGQFVDRGIGLGGEVPQTFGILCLNEVDHLIKEYYGIENFIRYMDDTIMVDSDINKIQYVICVIKDLLWNKYGLQLNEKKSTIVPATEGVKFLKLHFHISDTGKIWISPNKKSVKMQRRKMIKMADFVNHGIISYNDYKQSYNSYRGHLQRSNCYELINLFDQLVEWYIMYEEPGQYDPLWLAIDIANENNISLSDCGIITPKRKFKVEFGEGKTLPDSPQ